VRVKHFKGEVYNLETKGHWYTANCIVTHNCTCLQEEVILNTKTNTTTYNEQVQKFAETIEEKGVNIDVTLL